MSLRTGGLALGSTGGVRVSDAEKEAKRIVELRAEVKTKGLKVGDLREKVLAMREEAMGESTTAKAFEAFRTGPKAFEKEDRKEIVPDISEGKILDAKSSLFGAGQAPDSIEGMSTVSQTTSEGLASRQRSEETKEIINGVEVAYTEEFIEDEFIVEEVEESELAESEVAVGPETAPEVAPEVAPEAQPTREITKIEVKNEDKGDVRNIVSKFKDLEKQSEEQARVAKAEERRREMNRRSQQEAAAARERQMKIKEFEEKRKQREQILKKQAMPSPTTFLSRWPHGEPRKPALVIQYLEDLSADLDIQTATLELDLLHLEGQIIGS